MSESPTLELTALVVALIALVIALLQTIQQYVSSATARAKVNRAAIGTWSSKNQYIWSLREWKLRVQYARPKFTVDQAVKRIQNLQEKNDGKIKKELSGYDWVWSVPESSGGERSKVEISVYQLGDESQKPLPIASLTRRQRATIKEIELSMSNLYVPPCKATWHNLMIDLGLHPHKLPGTDLLDADTIASALDAPTMSMPMSELITFGFLLDMQITKFDLHERHIDMIGNLSGSITTRHQEGVGMLVRYSGYDQTDQPFVIDCSSEELDMSVQTTRGWLAIGDSQAQMMCWGYNSVNRVFTTVLERITNDKWEGVEVEDVMDFEDDSAPSWEGRWNQPMTPVVPFLLSFAGNMSVANAFPRRLLEDWTAPERQLASTSASKLLQNTVGFIDTPKDLFKTITDEDFHVFNSHDYKACYQYGCEQGGMRGWLATNFAEFTLRMSKCWVVSETTAQVPVLPHLHPFFRNGTLDAALGAKYNSTLYRNSNDQGEKWKMRANSLLWIQITMFDTWIAHRIESMMGNDTVGDAPVPADLDTATRCKVESGGVEISGWKKSRLSFALPYLERLAEGLNEKGASCMSTSKKRFANPELGWADMPVGTPHDWAVIDAVLTLRAIVMATRYEMMKDSSALLDLQEFDPTVQLA
ncbi:hypothetical protein BDZ94DRAFT_1249945 [Collybia nuda]|uniref:Uncharacterized protein n=1 Tax=Collybia nuda TaxID=64659 RepID=A0A9P6CND2_9AGAR|nr:hypothetical protein BDZ94DRAFT_1249945 [Collybia nuda]